MIEKILANTELVAILKNEVKENSACVELDIDFYLESGELDTEQLVNLAVDEYYNSLGLGYTPPSIDNLLVIKRGKDKFAVYLIELKDVKKLQRICNKSIKGKFDTTINDFMLERFSKEFNDNFARVTDLNLWLVCNRFTFMNRTITDEEYEKRIKNTVIERLLMIPPYRYKGKVGLVNVMFNNAEIC